MKERAFITPAGVFLRKKCLVLLGTFLYFGVTIHETF